MRRTPLHEQTVVITGASSGIGRQTAAHFGHFGARVVLAARNPEALAVAAREVEDAGGTALAVPTDVSDWEQVAALADAAEREFGRIDTWVNNAGVALYGTIAQVTPEEIRRVIEVNLLGEMYGTKAAFTHMRPYGEGVIINVSSALARRSVPLQSAYCAAKHGVSGFSESVRLELKRHHPGISLVEIMPASINTPLFAHARSRLGAMPMPIPPIYEPEMVARAIVRAAERPPREAVAGRSARLLLNGQTFSARLVDRYLLFAGKGERDQHSRRPDDGTDNLFAPSAGPGSTHGDWNDGAPNGTATTRLAVSRPGRTAAVAAAVMGGGALLLRRGRR